VSDDKQSGIDGLIGGWGDLGGGDYVRPTAGGWVFLSTTFAKEVDQSWTKIGDVPSVSVSTSASVAFIPDPTWSWKEYRRVCSRPAEGDA